MKLLKRFLSLAVTIFSIGIILVSWLYRQQIYDWWKLRNYSAPQPVAQLANATTMTQKAKNIFYINRPHISVASEFNAECSKESSIVLGCYTPSKGIYLYDVTDPRLAGVKEVTAAHEMLHAAYERLSKKERIRIDNMTQNAFSKLSNNRIKSNIEKYRQQDPQIVPNELHSILASEVMDLPADLERYYQQYFTNRKAVVEFSNRYEAEFDNRKAQVDNFDNQLSDLKLKIEANKNDLIVQYDALASEKSQLDSLVRNNNISEYNRNVPAFNAQVVKYNSNVRETDKLINNYNDLVEKRNNIAIEAQDLVKAIDSRPQSF